MKFLTYIFTVLVLIFLQNCSRADSELDVLSQEDISNIILNVKDDATQVTKTYNYTVNSVNNPIINLSDGKSYTVSVVFKNGNSDETESIISAKDEHFLIFDFAGADVHLERIDEANSTRTDGNKLGLLTKWTVLKAKDSSSPKMILTLIHDATAVSEKQNGSTFGEATGGETDAIATFEITN